MLCESDSGLLVRVCDHWKEVETLKKAYHKLKDEYSILKNDQYNVLKKSYDDLNTGYNILQNDYEVLQNVNVGLQKIIDEQSVEINCLKRLKPNKQHMYLVQWWYAPHDPIMAVKHYDALEDFLSDLAEDSSIIDIRVSALHPVKVTAKKVLTVQL
jgi:predicted nucleotide-binding protein (sugar kinase/HSP70/actin superfamily)